MTMYRTGDIQAITTCLYRYCRAMDRIDHALGYSVWHEDAQVDYGVIYKGSARGFIDWVCERHAGMTAHSHRISNILIDFAGDRAGSEAYVTVTLRYREAGRAMRANVCGRYVDSWSRRDGVWAIERRVYVHDFDDVREVTETLFEGWGRRDHEDPSYRAIGQG